jgi:hypothetical protein
MVVSEYPKIVNVFRRDAQTHAIKLGEFTTDELRFTASCSWSATEKVDGTNIRVIYPSEEVGLGYEIRGKTDRAQLSGDLIKAVRAAFPIDVLAQKCANATIAEPIVFYGEGYGPGIQKVGAAYRADKGFVLFDVRVGDWWLRRGDVIGLAEALGCDVVPEVAVGTLDYLVRYVSEAPVSVVAQRHGRMNVPMEGVVARPNGCELFTRKGERLIVKIKVRDFANHDAIPATVLA